MSNLEEEKDVLYEWLHAAILLELSTIPPYMTALISIHPKTNRVAAFSIRGVIMEEMLHITMAGNILSSIGGKLVFDASKIPVYPLSLEFEGKKFRNREFDVDLAPFSETSIETFTKIELPEDWKQEIKPLTTTAEIDVPAYTIGQFYGMIENKLEELCTEFGEDNVFTGNPAHQIDKNYYWAGGGQPVVVTNLQTAQEAIEVVVTQGEGTPQSVYDADEHYFEQPADVAHFFRFREILFGRHYQPGDNPHNPPTGEQFEVDYSQTYPIKVNAKSTDYEGDPHMAKLNNTFNHHYSGMLWQIAEAFNGTPKILYTAILNGMHDMTSVAMEMVKTPIANNPEGLNGSPSFEWVEPIV